MKEIKAYKCGYCGKLYQLAPCCARHENNHSLKNPNIRPVCFDCRLMQLTEETEDVPYGMVRIDGRFITVYKKFKRTTCKKTGAKMYVNMHLTDDVTTALGDEGWQAMPTHAEGCKHAKLYRHDYGKNDSRGETEGQGEED